MARHRVQPAVEVDDDDVDVLEVPVELGRCYVEDWVSPDEPADAGDTIGRGDLSWFMIVARRRWQEARRAFEIDNGLDHGEIDALGFGQPSFRDETPYLTAVGGGRRVRRGSR